MLGLDYPALTAKIEENVGKKYLTVEDYMLNKALAKVKENIDIEKFDDTKTLIDTDDNFPDNITFKNIVIFNDMHYKR